MFHRNQPFVISISPLLLLALLCRSCAATQLTVGDSSGWTVPPFSSYYTNWSLSHFFSPGDSLEFKFEEKFYNLVQVSSEYEYKHCSSFDIVKVFNSSPAVVELKEKGTFFFICNISNYCFMGQKVAIIVHDSSALPPPLPSPSSSPSLPPLATSPSSPPSEICCPGGSSPSSSPKGSAIREMPSPSGLSPQPSTTKDDNSKAVPLLPPTQSFNFLFSKFATLMGFLVHAFMHYLWISWLNS